MRNTLPKRICLICGKTYRDYPALSRTDHKTEICPDCGVVQGLEASGADAETINKVLQAIYASSKESDR